MYDFIILGQGLAGSLLAWRLLHAKQKVLVIDDGHRTASSRVAAGLINPLAGMRFNAAPETAAWLTSLHTTYDEISRSLQTRPYLHQIPMQRLLRSEEQRRFLERQQANPAVSAYLGRILQPDGFEPGIKAPFGGFEQHATAYVDLPRLLDDLSAWLDERDARLQTVLRYAEVEPGTNGIQLGSHRARHMVCCEGYRMQENPWFGDLPLQPDKGELLRLESPRRLCRHMINGAHWLVPLVEGGYRFGSTHEHHRIDNSATASGREALLQGLKSLLDDCDGITIREHVAGVRPATRDRMPLIGTHAERAHLHLFNGFGARGALTIPWYSERMQAYLLEQHPLPQAADIRRYA